jgi:hypothetical protein
MLTEKEIAFMNHWESVRKAQSSFSSKLLRGLPMAMFFGLPILFSIAAVYFLSPEWYTKISQQADHSTLVVLIAVCIAVFFFSFMRMHFKWEMNEQLYDELKYKQKQIDIKP